MKIQGIIVILFLVLGALSLPACSMPAYLDSDYLSWLKEVSQEIEKNPDYKRIPIDTKDQQEDYLKLAHKAFNKEISTADFISEMSDRYPEHLSSIVWLSEQLPD